MACKRCKQSTIDKGETEELYDELCAQADALGMESLTENQQALVNGDLCANCFEEAENEPILSNEQLEKILRGSVANE